MLAVSRDHGLKAGAFPWVLYTVCGVKNKPFHFFSPTESHDVISVIESNLLRLLFNWVYTILFQISCYLPLHFTVNAAVCTAPANKIKCNSCCLEASIASVIIPAGSWLCCWEWVPFSASATELGLQD